MAAGWGRNAKAEMVCSVSSVVKYYSISLGEASVKSGKSCRKSVGSS